MIVDASVHTHHAPFVTWFVARIPWFAESTCWFPTFCVVCYSSSLRFRDAKSKIIREPWRWLPGISMDYVLFCLPEFNRHVWILGLFTYLLWSGLNHVRKYHFGLSIDSRAQILYILWRLTLVLSLLVNISNGQFDCWWQRAFWIWTYQIFRIAYERQHLWIFNLFSYVLVNTSFVVSRE